VDPGPILAGPQLDRARPVLEAERAAVRAVARVLDAGDRAGREEGDRGG
jgi:hypothetical protein